MTYHKNSILSQQTHRTTHGRSYTATYRAWQKMKERCLNPNHKHSNNYKGRGITFCEGVAHFEGFFAVVGEKPSPQLSIDRKNNDGNYSCGKCDQCVKAGWPMNLRWADKSQQQNNTRSNRMLTLSDRTQSLTLWSRELHIKVATLRKRKERGDSDERALTTPVRTR